MNNNTRYFLMTGFVGLIFCRCHTGNLPIEEKPVNATWEKTGPGGGGATFTPTFSYHHAENFLLRCDMTGSYLTKDGGLSYQQINFPNGATSYAYDPLDSNVIYVGSAVLNQSVDGGKTWKTVFPKEKEITKAFFRGDHANYEIETATGSLYESGSESVSNIRVDPSSSASLYFSMGNFFFYTGDHGETWKKQDCEAPVMFIYTNRINEKNRVLIFTAKAAYVFDKTKGTLLKKDLPVSMSPAFSFTGGLEKKTGKVIFYALHHYQKDSIENEFGHSEMWMSIDLGNTWKPIMNPVVTNTTAGIKPSLSMVACAEFDAGQVYLVTNRYEERMGNSWIYWYGAMHTKDGGNNWYWVWKGGGGSGQYGIRDGKGVSNLKDAWAEKAFGGEYIRLMDVGVDPHDGNVAIVTDWYRAMKTINGGDTWNEIYSREQPDGSYISRGLDVTTTYGVHTDPFDSNHMAISYTDIGYHHSFNRGKSWIRSTEGVPTEWINTCYWVVFDPSIKNKLWSAWSGMHDFPRGKMTRNPKWKETAKGGICVSNDGGRTWKPSNIGMGFDSPVTCIVLDSSSKPGARILYAAVYNKGVFKSTDDGESWKLMNHGIEGNTCAFELTLTNNGNLYLVVSAAPVHKDGKKGRAIYSGAVYRSVDGAVSWTKLNVSTGFLFPNGLEFDRRNPDRLYLACWSDIDLSDLIGGDIAKSTGGNTTIKMPGGVFLSEDAGKTWVSIFDDKQYVYDVTADPFHPGRLYINTFNQAAYRSDDDGKSWNKIIGYDFHWGHRVVVDQNDPEKIYLTTFGSSVWHGNPLIRK